LEIFELSLKIGRKEEENNGVQTAVVSLLKLSIVQFYVTLFFDLDLPNHEESELSPVNKVEEHT
jgi:hypothetical protein